MLVSCGDYHRLFVEHVTGLLGLGTEVVERAASRLVEKYCKLAKEDWTDAKCCAGLDVIKKAITAVVEVVLPLEGGDAAKSFDVLSGCRPGKLSFHMVMRHVHCDSQVVSMPLVVSEIAREFCVSNLKCLLQSLTPGELDTAEAWFRIKAMMLDSLADFDGGQGDGGFYFTGFDDTPFDEAIYTPNNLL